MPASARLCLSARNTASKLDTRTGPGPRESEASKRGAVWGVLEGVSPPTCLLRSRWPYPAAPFAPLLTRSRAGVFIGKLCDSRALRRVVVEPFQERKSAGSPPEVSKPPWGRFCSSFGAFLGHSACPPSLRPPRALAMHAAPRKVRQNASDHGSGRGAGDHSWRWATIPSPCRA